MVLKNVGTFGGKEVEYNCDLVEIIWQLPNMFPCTTHQLIGGGSGDIFSSRVHIDAEFVHSPQTLPPPVYAETRCVGDQAHNICVFCKLHYMIYIYDCTLQSNYMWDGGASAGCNGMRWDAMDLNRLRPLCQEGQEPLAGRHGFSLNSSNLLIEACGVIVLKAELKTRKSSITCCGNPCCPGGWGQSGWQLTLHQTQTDSSWKHTDGGPRWCWWRPLCGKKTAIQSTAWLLGWGPPVDSHLCFLRLSRGLSIDIAESSTWAKFQCLVMLMFSKCW